MSITATLIGLGISAAAATAKGIAAKKKKEEQEKARQEQERRAMIAKAAAQKRAAAQVPQQAILAPQPVQQPMLPSAQLGSQPQAPAYLPPPRRLI